MQAPKLTDEDTSNGFELDGWADKYWNEVMELLVELNEQGTTIIMVNIANTVLNTAIAL